VVCVDDDPAVLRALRRLLEREPYRVLATVRPRQALQWLDEREVGLMITDQRMPDLSGHELIEEVRRRSPETPCLIVTAYPDHPAVVAAARRDRVAVIAKPWDGGELKRAIRRWLAAPPNDGRAGAP
jgi:DNA-binding NtrC family response regulator